MTLSFKSITFWFFFLAPLTAGALTPADTSSKKSPLQMVAPGYRLSDYTMLLKDAIASFKQDSVDKGMALLSKTIKNIRSQRDAKRIKGAYRIIKRKIYNRPRTEQVTEC
jgi:hypothetical protein